MKRYIITFSEHIKSSIDALKVLNKSGVSRNEVAPSTMDMAMNFESKSECLYLSELDLLLIDLEDHEVNVLQNDSDIIAIEEDQETKIYSEIASPNAEIMHPDPPVRWNMAMISADAAWRSGKFGRGVKVAVLDTGIAWHPNLQTIGGVSFIAGEPNFRDEHGHGTHCAGIIASKGRNDVLGVAPGIDLYSVKVLSRQGTGSQAALLSGMNWCLNVGVNVLSMSLGASVAPSSAYARAIRKCQGRGSVVVCATGNAFTTNFPWVGSPANSFVAGDPLSSPIAVGSVDSNRNIASSSSRGVRNANWNPVTLVAPGVSILSTHLNGGYRFLSGTSMACPHVAGLVALLLNDNPAVSPLLIKALMTTSAEQLGQGPYPNEAFGDGLINCSNALGISESRMKELKTPESI